MSVLAGSGEEQMDDGEGEYEGMEEGDDYDEEPDQQ
tara:strand:+ start:1510 stop:1617 length:108 start_codon:yes stop_codon:yes gene_type:complete